MNDAPFLAGHSTIAGLGGGIEMLGRYNTFSWGSLPGYGWTGMTVAIIAGNNPLFVPFAAFFMAYLDKGCSLMSTYSGVPAQLNDAPFLAGHSTTIFSTKFY